MEILPVREYEVYRACAKRSPRSFGRRICWSYLRTSVPTLVDQILSRGRSYEENISLEYLRRLNKAYEAWFQTYDRGPKMVISMDELHGRDDAPARLVDMVAKQIFLAILTACGVGLS